MTDSPIIGARHLFAVLATEDERVVGYATAKDDLIRLIPALLDELDHRRARQLALKLGLLDAREWIAGVGKFSKTAAQSAGLPSGILRRIDTTLSVVRRQRSG